MHALRAYINRTISFIFFGKIIHKEEGGGHKKMILSESYSGYNVQCISWGLKHES